VRRPVGLYDDRESELLGDACGIGRAGRATPWGERHAETLEDERRFVLGQRASGGKQVGYVWDAGFRSYA
jgi:hypothetical protein